MSVARRVPVLTASNPRAVTLTHFPTSANNAAGSLGPKEERDELVESIKDEIQRTWAPVTFTVRASAKIS